MYEHAKKIVEKIKSLGWEGDVLAFAEERLEVQSGWEARILSQRRAGFSTRWNKEKAGVFFLFTTSPTVNFNHGFMIGENWELRLPSYIKKNPVKIRDERGLPYGEELEFPTWIEGFSALERKVFLLNTKGGEASYTETLYSFRASLHGEEFSIWSRIRDFPLNLQGNGGRNLVLHPFASFKLVKFILSGKATLKGVEFTVEEDPSLDYGPGSFPFDASGREMKKRTIFRKGKIKARKPIHLLRPTPDSPPTTGWTNIILNLPPVSCSSFTLAINLRFYGEITQILLENGTEREMKTEDLLRSIQGKIQDGFFIGPPFIKSDYILLY